MATSTDKGEISRPNPGELTQTRRPRAGAALENSWGARFNPDGISRFPF